MRRSRPPDSPGGHKQNEKKRSRHSEVEVDERYPDTSVAEMADSTGGPAGDEGRNAAGGAGGTSSAVEGAGPTTAVTTLDARLNRFLLVSLSAPGIPRELEPRPPPVQEGFDRSLRFVALSDR